MADTTPELSSTAEPKQAREGREGLSRLRPRGESDQENGGQRQRETRGPEQVRTELWEIFKRVGMGEEEAGEGAELFSDLWQRSGGNGQMAEILGEMDQAQEERLTNLLSLVRSEDGPGEINRNTENFFRSLEGRESLEPEARDAEAGDGEGNAQEEKKLLRELTQRVLENPQVMKFVELNQEMMDQVGKHLEKMVLDEHGNMDKKKIAMLGLKVAAGIVLLMILIEVAKLAVISWGALQALQQQR